MTNQEEHIALGIIFGFNWNNYETFILDTRSPDGESVCAM